MAGRSDCRQCGAAVPEAANYCPRCGAPHALVVSDPLGVDPAPVLTTVSGDSSHRRLGLAAGLGLLAGLAVLVWVLSRPSDSTPDETPRAATPDNDVAAADTTTTSSTTTTSATTTAPSTAPEQLYVNDSPGPVLEDGVGGVLVAINARTMYRVDLATGEVEEIDLEEMVGSIDAAQWIVLRDQLISVRDPRAIIVTNLSTGEQRALANGPDSADGNGVFIAGAASTDSLWLAAWPQQGEPSTVVELGLDDQIRREFEFATPFWAQWANGNILYLNSIDRSWRYDTSDGAVTELPGRIITQTAAPLIMATCQATLECGVLVDSRDGPTKLEGVPPDIAEIGSINVAPNQREALLHVYGDQGIDFTHLDLITGAVIELGELPIMADLGVVWIEGSRWIIGRSEGESGSRWQAVNTETKAQIELDLPFPSGQVFGTVLLLAP